MLGLVIAFLCALSCHGQPGIVDEIIGCDEFAHICYDPCGCFNNSYPFNDWPLPMHPSEQELEFDLYTKENMYDKITIEWSDDVDAMVAQLPEWYDNTLKTKFMVHGWTPRVNGFPSDFKNCPNDEFISGEDSEGETGVKPEVRYGFTDIKNALLELYDYNVFIVQWKEGAGFVNYGQSVTNAQVAGACSAHFATREEVTESPKQLHCMGHSLGGQVCGNMGYHAGGTMARITGLDPAGPAFDREETELRLDRSDADLVDIIHTNVNSTSGLITLGMGQAVGHKDFYPNGGGRQPQCNEFYCDHQAPSDYYYSSIASNCTFLSFPCESWEDIELGNCIHCQDGVDCQTMGYYADEHPGEGTFYTETTEEYPFCKASDAIP